MFTLRGKYVAAGSPPQEEGIPPTGRRTSRATTSTHGGEDPRRGRHRAAGSVRRLRLRPDDDRDRIRRARSSASGRRSTHTARSSRTSPGRSNGTSARPATSRLPPGSTRRSSASGSKRWTWAEGAAVHVFKLGDRGVAGIFEINERHGGHAAELDDASSRWRTPTLPPRRRRSWAARCWRRAGHARSAASRCCRIRPARSSRSSQPPSA